MPVGEGRREVHRVHAEDRQHSKLSFTRSMAVSDRETVSGLSIWKVPSKSRRLWFVMGLHLGGLQFYRSSLSE